MLLANSNNIIEFRREFQAKMDPRINIRWGDWMLEEDNKRNDYYLDLSDSEWEELVKNHLSNFKGDIRSAIAWVQRVHKMRIERSAAKAEERPREVPSELDITFRLWKDMIEEPWKYSDEDWPDWLEMDRELRNSQKRWRVAAFWQAMQDEEDEINRKAFIQMLVDAKSAFNNRMATRIQAAWRGHKVRDTQPQLNCGMCLAHVPCRYTEGDKFICWDCAYENEGMYPCCSWCNVVLDEGQEAFCDGDCYRKYMNESWKD